jgi:hypothetical protein
MLAAAVGVLVTGACIVAAKPVDWSRVSGWSLAGDGLFCLVRPPRGWLDLASDMDTCGRTVMVVLVGLGLFVVAIRAILAGVAADMAGHLSLAAQPRLPEAETRKAMRRLATPLALATPAMIGIWIALLDPTDSLILRMVRAVVLGLLFLTWAMLLGGAMASACVEGKRPVAAIRRMLQLLRAQKGHFVRAAVYGLPRWLGLSSLSWLCAWATLLLPFLIATRATPFWIGFFGPVDSFVLRAGRVVLLFAVGLFLLLLWGIMLKTARLGLLRTMAAAGIAVTVWCFFVFPLLPRHWSAGGESWLAEAWGYLWQGRQDVSSSTAIAVGIAGGFVLLNSLVMAGMWLFLYPLAAGVCAFHSLRRAAEGVDYRASVHGQQGATTSLLSPPGTFLFSRGGASALETFKPPRGWLALMWIGFRPRTLFISFLVTMAVGLVGILAVALGDAASGFRATEQLSAWYGIGLLTALGLCSPLLCRDISLRLRKLNPKSQQRLLKASRLPFYALATWGLFILNMALLALALVLAGTVGLIPHAGPIVWALLYPLMLPGANILVISALRWIPASLILPAVAATDIGPSGTVTDVYRQTEYYATASPWALLGAILTSLPFALAPALAMAVLFACATARSGSGPALAVGVPALIAAEVLAVVGLVVTITNAYLIVRQTQGDQPLRVGDLVTPGRHAMVRGDDNWNPDMEVFVGRQGRIRAFVGRDGSGCEIVRVDVDGGRFVWRVMNLSRPTL